MPEGSESSEARVAFLPQMQELRVGFYLFYQKKKVPYSQYLCGKLVASSDGAL